MLIGFLCIFLGVMGVGIVIPLTPYLARFYEASAFQIGILMGCYSIMQFFFAPIWGGLSDKYGRRKIMTITLFGVGMGYIIFSFATNLWWLMAGRLICGIFAANIGLALAYMTDLSEKKYRSKAYAIVGIGLCLGFIFGPIIGAGIIKFGEYQNWSMRSIYTLPSLVTTFLYIISSAVAFFYMKETRPQKVEKMSFSRFQNLVRQKPLLLAVLGLIFIKVFALASMEASLFLFLKEYHAWPLSKASLSFAVIGVCMAISQGWLIRSYVHVIEERRFLILGLFAASWGLLGMGLCPDLIGFFTSIVIFGVAYGLTQPTANALASSLVSTSTQGVLFGVITSLGALGRALGPPLGGWFYDKWIHLPFIIASIFFFLSFLGFVIIYPKLPNLQKRES